MDKFIKLLPDLGIVLAIFCALTGSCIVALTFTGFVVGALLWFRIPRPDQASVDNILQPDRVSLVAHRGAGDDAPENTLAAFRVAKENGADAIEFDVDYTSDGVAVVIHDETVDRTTDGMGEVRKLNHSRVSLLNAAAKHPLKSQFNNERIPTLEDAVQTCLELDLRMYIDVKGNAKRSAEVLCALYEKYPRLYNMAIVCSFYPDIVYLVRRLDPKIVAGLTWRPWYVSCKDIYGPYRDAPIYRRWLNLVLDMILRWMQFSFLWFLCGSSAFLIHKDVVSRDVVYFLEERGIKPVVWTVNNPVEKSFLGQGLKVTYMTDSLKKKS